MKALLALTVLLALGTQAQARTITRSQTPIDSKTALVIVDAQNDFLPGGTLAVATGNEIVKPMKMFMNAVATMGGSIFASQDWHPAGHISFKSSAQGGIWPDHCLRGTRGAQIQADIAAEMINVQSTFGIPTTFVHKGTEVAVDSYSAFGGTNLAAQLRKRGVKRVIVGGLATDYCVKATVLDALKAGFEVVFLGEASRGVDVKAGDSAKAIAEMEAAGALIEQ